MSVADGREDKVELDDTADVEARFQTNIYLLHSSLLLQLRDPRFPARNDTNIDVTTGV